MPGYQKIIKPLVVGYALFLTFSLHPIRRIRSLQLFQGVGQFGSGDLQRDETILARDMRDLRGHLRRGADPLMIAEERRDIRRDWVNVVLDRRPRAVERNGAMTEVARSKARGGLPRRRSSQWHDRSHREISRSWAVAALEFFTARQMAVAHPISSSANASRDGGIRRRV